MIELTGIKKDGTREPIDINSLPQSSQLKIKARFAIKALIYDYMELWTAGGDAESDPDEYNACLDELANKITDCMACKAALSAMDDLSDTATRLRRVARLAGCAAAVPDDDATAVGCIASVLGVIASVLGVIASHLDK